MSDTAATATFSVVLRDGVSGSAATAGSALAALKKKISDDTRSLGEMQKALRNLKGGTSTSASAFRELSNRIAAQKAAIASAQSQYVSLGGTFGDVQGGIQGLLADLSKAPGPLGAVASRLGSMGGALGSTAGLAGLAVTATLALVAALTALVAAAGAAAVALAQYALASADARRSELLHLEGLTTIRNHFGVAAGSATELQAAIDRVATSSALARPELTRYSEMLYRMGLRGDNLSEALEGVSIVAAVQGEEYARRFAGMAAGAARTGGSVRRLADDVRGRLGGIAARAALALDVQMRHLREGLAGLFSGLRIEGFLRGLRQITSLFDSGSATGEALRAVLGSIFNPFFDSIGEGAPLVRSFFEGLIIGGLRLGIGFLRVRNSIRRAFGSETVGSIDGVRAATLAGVVVVSALAVAVIGLAAVVLLLASPFLLVGAAVYFTLEALETWYTIARATVTAVSGLFAATDWSALGHSLIDGFIGGLRAGYARVTAAVRGLASSATTALTDALGIASPSRVFAELGVEIPRGLAVGVETAAPRASRAVEGLSASVASDFAPTAEGGAVTSSTSATAIGPFYINVSGASGEEQGENLRAQLIDIFEGLGLNRGAPV